MIGTIAGLWCALVGCQTLPILVPCMEVAVRHQTREEYIAKIKNMPPELFKKYGPATMHPLVPVKMEIFYRPKCVDFGNGPWFHIIGEVDHSIKRPAKPGEGGL